MRLKGGQRVGEIKMILTDYQEVKHYVHGIPQFILVDFPEHNGQEAELYWCAPTQLKRI